MSELRARLFRATSRGELPFRPRGEHHSRLEAFSDAVLAFGITLTVLSLEVPHDSHEMLEMFRGFVSFAVTFGVLLSVWVMQNRWCRRFGLEDSRTIWTMGGILFVTLFYTYPLKFVSAAYFDRLLGGTTFTLHREDAGNIFMLYGAGYCALCALFASLYEHAWGLRDLLELDEAERFDTRVQIANWRDNAGFGLIILSMKFLDLAQGRARSVRLAVALGILALLLGGGGVLLTRVLKRKREYDAFSKRWNAEHPLPEPK